MRKLIICFYVIYVFTITYFSLTPIEHTISKSVWDKASHFIAYLILVILIRMVHVRFNYLTCVIICFSYSFIIECIQYFIPDRSFSILDMLANLLGTVMGAIIYYLIIEKCFKKWRGTTVKAVNK